MFSLPHHIIFSTKVFKVFQRKSYILYTYIEIELSSAFFFTVTMFLSVTDGVAALIISLTAFFFFKVAIQLKDF